MKQFILLALMCATMTGFAQDKQERKQCAGTTGNGVQCTKAAKPESKDGKYCSTHNPDTQCTGKTDKGERCRKQARKGEKKCHLHEFQKD